MGIGAKFGFGNKEPYRAPREVTALRTKIEAENRENFPPLARYKELMREAAQVYAALDAEIAKKIYAEEAGKISEDIRKRLEMLADKIRKNAQGPVSEGRSDYVESNIDYLARKSVRNSAKTLFTEFLEGHERFSSCIQDAGPGCNEIVDAASAMLQAMTALNENYFKKHGGDREIIGMKDLLLSKIAEIDRSYQENRTRLREKAQEAAIEPQVRRLLTASRDLAAL